MSLRQLLLRGQTQTCELSVTIVMRGYASFERFLQHDSKSAGFFQESCNT